MSYQNVGTPRFYISRSAYLMATGQDPVHWAAGQWGGYDTPGTGNGYTETLVRKILAMNPAHTNFLSADTSGSGEVDLNTHFNSFAEWDINFVAVLNHNLATKGQRIQFNVAQASDESNQDNMTVTNIVNYVNANTPPELDGFTIVKVANTGGNSFYEQLQIYLQDADNIEGVGFGTIAFGKYFDCPVSPDMMSLTMSHSYDGVKQITTLGGSTLSNANYYKPPMWGENREAWQLGDFPYYYNGRRSWDLTFSFISDSDIEPYNYYGVKFNNETGTPTAISETGDNWFQNVIRMTQGGHLPFIFSPDPSIEYYHNADANYEINQTPRVPEFAICRFDMSTFKRTQVSFKTYNIKVKIVESW